MAPIQILCQGGNLDATYDIFGVRRLDAAFLRATSAARSPRAQARYTRRCRGTALHKKCMHGRVNEGLSSLQGRGWVKIHPRFRRRQTGKRVSAKATWRCVGATPRQPRSPLRRVATPANRQPVPTAPGGVPLFSASQGRKATMRTGEPVPPSIFMGRAMTRNPLAGSRSILATFSRAQIPAWKRI